MSEVRVPIAGLAPGETRVFDLDAERQGIVIALPDGVGSFAVYLNRCPHAGYRLDLGDGDVLDPAGELLFCQSHGAEFSPATGRCVAGPAAGQALTALPFERDGSALFVQVPPPDRDQETPG